MKTLPYENPYNVPCCLCDNRAEWAHYNNQGVFINTYCNNHRPL